MLRPLNSRAAGGDETVGTRLIYRKLIREVGGYFEEIIGEVYRSILSHIILDI
jgi:hypothetical protein